MVIAFAPQSWDGSVIDARGVANVKVWCTAAPSVAPALQGSPDNGTNYFAQSISQNKSTGVTAVATLANVALYTVPGQQFLRLDGGTGGTFFIAGAN